MAIRIPFGIVALVTIVCAALPSTGKTVEFLDAGDACTVAALALKANTSDEFPWVLYEGEPYDQENWRSAALILQTPEPGVDRNDHLAWHRVFEDGRAPELLSGPSEELAEAYEATKPTNAVICPEVSAYAAKKKKFFAATISKRPGRRNVHNRTPKKVIINKAVLAPNGQEAMLYFATNVFPDGGSGMVIRYHKDKHGDWYEFAIMNLWIT